MDVFALLFAGFALAVAFNKLVPKAVAFLLIVCASLLIVLAVVT